MGFGGLGVEVPAYSVIGFRTSRGVPLRVSGFVGTFNLSLRV